jgi:hypothetical protein
METFAQFLKRLGYEAKDGLCELAGPYHIIDGIPYSDQDLH